jgi:putative nucleotidyltransferase with HDIG domain
LLGLRALVATTGQGLKQSLTDPKTRQVGAVLAFFLCLTFLVSVNFFDTQPRLSKNQVAPRDIWAPYAISFEDPVKTNEERERARAQVKKQYDVDPQVSVAIQNDISNLTAKIRAIQDDKDLQQQAKIERIKAIVPVALPADVLAGLASGTSQATAEMTKEVNSRIARLMDASEQGVSQDELPQARRDLISQLQEAGLSRPYELLARGLVNEFLRPNAFYNAELTREMQDAAAEKVQPVIVSIRKDEKIIGKGEIITEEHALKLEKLGLLKKEFPLKRLFGAAFLVAILMAVVGFYIHRHDKNFSRRFNNFYLLGIVVLTVLLIGKVLVAIKVSQWPEFGELMGYTIPLGAAGMLLAILLESNLAILVVAAMSLLTGAMTGGGFNFAVVGLVGGIAGVYSVSKLSQRTDLVRAGFYVGGISALVIFAIEMMLGDASWGLVITSSLVLGLANGLLCSVLANGALPFLESTFDISSAFKLLELANPGQPLLRRLLIEAPGTYHHSIIVGNLAEAAAEAVGGDSLLVRVGAYYHDVGKIRRPYFFIENQVGSENPHDKITPSLSTLIVTSHVKDGVEFAREHRLPQAVIDIIEQHHGTSLINFFYHKARKQDEKDLVKEEDYRYEGPKPQTREAAIVMLADAVEAAVRSLERPSPGQLEGLVRKLIKEKLADGQFDECDLNFRDLDIIGSAFTRVLGGIFHNRIEYPDPKEIERRRARSARRNQ